MGNKDMQLQVHTSGGSRCKTARIMVRQDISQLRVMHKLEACQARMSSGKPRCTEETWIQAHFEAPCSHDVLKSQTDKQRQ